MRAFLDFEASSLAKASYPIEVAWVWEDGRMETHLIRPAPGWIDWDARAAAIHGIDRTALIAEGVPHDEVACRVLDALAGHIVYASSPSWDGKWLSVLLRSAGLPRHALRLTDTDEAQLEAARAGLETRVPPEAIEATAKDLIRRVRTANDGPIAHRALPDARHELWLWQDQQTGAGLRTGVRHGWYNRRQVLGCSPPSIGSSVVPPSPPMPQTRVLESPIATSVSCWRFETVGDVLMQPDNCWDIAFLRSDDRVTILRTGMTTRPDVVAHRPGDEILTVSFRPETFMPLLPGESMRNAAVVLEAFGRKDFSIGGDIREIPNFENAEMFVERLRRDGVVDSNPIVASVLSGNRRAMSERTLQRHFLKTTGLTYKHFTLIERAQQAAALLQMGRSAVDVALTLGYADQAHLINSVRQIMGQTPGEIARAAGG